jgi:16S rRNA (uracil1498-N3)-methyltransferase
VARLYCPKSIRLNEAFALPETAARHVQVLRLQPGDDISLFDGLGNAYLAQVVSMGRQEVRVCATAARPLQAIPERSVTLLVGMPANERMDWLVEKATELGVTRVVPLLTERTVVRLQGERAARRVAHWQAIAAAACEQSGRDLLPRIEPVQSLQEWLSTDHGPDPLRIRLSLAPESRPAMDLSIAPHQALHAALGPEGGWSSAEELALAAASYAPISLGPAVLRTETAALTVLARWACAAPSK